tara:strand:- start:1646 stop:3220 length:1575 start_codon:yes stop_codon:yes gene_type:complete
MAKIDTYTFYGYSQDALQSFRVYNKNIPKYSFQVKKMNKTKDANSGIDYWYAYRRDEFGKIRTRFLGKCFKGLNEHGETSFQLACNKLKDRYNEGFISNTLDKRQLTYFIDLFVADNQKKIDNPTQSPLSYKTLQQHNNGVKQYRKWLVDKDVKLFHTQDIKHYQSIVKDYVDWLRHRKKTTKFGKITDESMKIGTIRTYLKNVRAFHLWLADDSFGGGFVALNPLTDDYYKSVIRNFGLIYTKSNDRQSRLRRISRDYFSKKGYETMVEDCVSNVRKIWTTYCESGEIPREFANQPKNQMGSNIVYFVSLFQLGLGFRVGEILQSFRSVEGYDQHIINPQDSGAFWYKTNGTWVIEINWKGKYSVLPTNDIDYFNIRTWIKPKNWKGKPSGNNGKEDYYDTHLVEVCMEMFSESPFLFTAYRNSHKHYSYSQYNNNFKNICIGKHEWDNFGVDTTHDLRHYFITRHIQLRTDPLLISKITRHSITTMMKFYVEENVDMQKEMVRDIGINIGKYKPIRNKPNDL